MSCGENGAIIVFSFGPMISPVCYAMGYLTGAVVFVWAARRRGLATAGVRIVMAAGLVGGLAAANLTQWIATGLPGKTVLGGIAGGYLSVIVAKKVVGLRRPLGDMFAFAICGGEAVGRWGCFFGGCCYGRPTSVPWAIWQHGALRHPTQIYMSLSCALIFVLLLRIERLSLPENHLFFIEGLLYSMARFLIEFAREVPRIAGGLSEAQWACLACMAFFGWKLCQCRRPVIAGPPAAPGQLATWASQ